MTAAGSPCGNRAMTAPVPSRGSAGLRDDGTDSIRLRVRLMQETGCGEAEAGLAVGRALERFRNARIREFVTLLAERDARRQLHAWHRDRVTRFEPEA